MWQGKDAGFLLRQLKDAEFNPRQQKAGPEPFRVGARFIKEKWKSGTTLGPDPSGVGGGGQKKSKSIDDVSEA